MNVKNLLMPLLFLLLSSPSAGIGAEGDCRSFRACHERAKAARAEKDFSLGLKFFSRACAMEVKPSLVGLRFSSCQQVIEFSKTVDNYATARAQFGEDCGRGLENGCFFLGKLAEEQGNLARAMEIMEPLCDSGFRHKGVSGYDGCDALKIMKLKWKSLHPDPPRKNRTGPLQIGAFLAVFVFVVLSPIDVIRSFVKKSRQAALRALIFSLLGFAVYGFYESGVSPYAAIRIDLLLLLPTLLLNLCLTVLAAIRFSKWG